MKSLIIKKWIEKITINDLPQIRKAQTSSRAANSGVKGTKDNPYFEDKALSWAHLVPLPSIV